MDASADWTEGPSINKDYGVFIHDLAKALKPKDKLFTGVMIWSLDNDVKGERSLLSALHESLVAQSTSDAKPTEAKSAWSLSDNPDLGGTGNLPVPPGYQPGGRARA